MARYSLIAAWEDISQFVLNAAPATHMVKKLERPQSEPGGLR